MDIFQAREVIVRGDWGDFEVCFFFLVLSVTATGEDGVAENFGEPNGLKVGPVAGSKYWTVPSPGYW